MTEAGARVSGLPKAVLDSTSGETGTHDLLITTLYRKIAERHC